jgi:hypothetical protein
MTSPSPIQTLDAAAADAHVLTALQAACAFGRETYLADQRNLARENEIELALKKALEAYRKFSAEVASSTDLEPATPVVIGGGSKLTGRVLWTLQNHGAMTTKQLSAFLGITGSEVTTTTAHLKSLGKVSAEKFTGKYTTWGAVEVTA